MLIKSFNGHSEAFYARATRPHRDRICHCDHYGIVGTSSPRDGRRWHCRYSVPGMQMAPPRMVICRLIRPALSQPKTPNYSHSRVKRVCRTVRRNPGSVLTTIGSYADERIGFENFYPEKKLLPPPPEKRLFDKLFLRSIILRLIIKIFIDKLRQKLFAKKSMDANLT